MRKNPAGRERPTLRGGWVPKKLQALIRSEMSAVPEQSTVDAKLRKSHHGPNLGTLWSPQKLTLTSLAKKVPVATHLN